MWVPSYTLVSLLLLVLGCFEEDAWSVAKATVVFVNASFHAAILMRPGVVRVYCLKKGWSHLQFHVGNAVVHLFPLFLVSYVYDYTRTNALHVIASDAIFLMWLATVLDLNEVYAPLPSHAWAASIAVGVFAQLLCCATPPPWTR